MTTIKSYTDIEQSRKLAEFLPLKSANMRFCFSHTLGGRTKGHYPMIGREPSSGTLPCWSLAALLNVLPSSIKDSIGMVYSLNMNKEYIEYSNPNISSLYSAYIHTCGNDNLVDACVEMIEKLHELKML